MAHGTETLERSGGHAPYEFSSPPRKNDLWPRPRRSRPRNPTPRRPAEEESKRERTRESTSTSTSEKDAEEFSFFIFSANSRLSGLPASKQGKSCCVLGGVYMAPWVYWGAPLAAMCYVIKKFLGFELTYLSLLGVHTTKKRAKCERPAPRDATHGHVGNDRKLPSEDATQRRGSCKACGGSGLP